MIVAKKVDQVLKVEPVIKQYAWGSHESLARLGDRPTPTAHPEAELWLGAHEAGPAIITETGQTLDSYIAEGHSEVLGDDVASRFGGRLPFLLKILAAEKALSIQAHPNAHRARNAPEGIYGDPWPKPEAWVPLEESEAFLGCLRLDDVAQRVGALKVPRLSDILRESQGKPRPEHALLKTLLTLSSNEQEQLVGDVMRAIDVSLKRLADGDSSAPSRVASRETDDESADDAETRALRAIAAVHDDFPGDIGVVVLLLMKHVVMKPGSSYFIGAGVLHCFVRGTTIEILANSDNVVRAGLTPKEINVGELLEIVDTTSQVVAESPETDGSMRRYPAHVEHFALLEVGTASEPRRIPCDGAPALFLAVDGDVELTCGGEKITLKKLEGAWSSARDDSVYLAAPFVGSSENTRPGRVFVATLNPGDARDSSHSTS